MGVIVMTSLFGTVRKVGNCERIGKRQVHDAKAVQNNTPYVTIVIDGYRMIAWCGRQGEMADITETRRETKEEAVDMNKSLAESKDFTGNGVGVDHRFWSVAQ